MKEGDTGREVELRGSMVEKKIKGRGKTLGRVTRS
jgi:hypothetical protein